MIRLSNTRLARAASAGLRRYQKEIDRLPDFPARVAAAKKQFKKRNIKKNKTFSEVRKALTRMCSGARRCMYCEDSVADQVEHIRPKDFYPEAVFVWKNYLYACGPCNKKKSNKFVVLTPSGTVEGVTRSPGSAVVPPLAGTPVFIDPRSEDGLQYMQLDLVGTFLFVPTAAANTFEHSRAEHTIDILKLNERDYLVDARKSAYRSYVALLEQYANGLEAGMTPLRLARLRDSLLRMGHPTVWAEMQRQHRRLKQLRSLFERVPDALTWQVQ